MLTAALLRRARRRAPPIGETIVADGVPLQYLESGSGPPVVFLDDAGHQPHFTRPNAVLEAVDEAWRRAVGEVSRFDSPRPRG